MQAWPHYTKNQLANLIPLLNDSAHRQRAAEIVRGLLDRILLSPITDDNTGKTILDVHIQGHLAGIFSLAFKEAGESKTAQKDSAFAG